MLGFFRRNLFINLFFLLLFAVILMGYLAFIPMPVETKWSLPVLDELFSGLISRWVLFSLTIGLLVIQAYLLNDLVIKHKLSRALSTIPAAVLILYSAFCLEEILFHPILIANLFFMLSVGSLFKIYKRHQPIATMFNSGFFLAISILIYPAYIVFTLLLILGLFSLRNLNLRESLQMIIGLLLPFFLLWVFLYYQGEGWSLWTMIKNNFSLPSFDLSNWAALAKGGLVLLLIIIGLALHTDLKKKKKFDSIKKIELTYWMLFLSLFSVFYINPVEAHHFLILAIPLGLLMGLIMETKNNAIIKEFVFLLAIGVYAVYLLDII